MTKRNTHTVAGFTLVEMLIGILVLGVVLIAFSSIFILFQKGSAQTTEVAEAQQNARLAVDYVTDMLRMAGAATDYTRGQMPIVHAGPYQIAFNADVDAGETIDGQAPLAAMNRAYSPNRVPPSGTAIYSPTATYQTGAETIELTLDSNLDGVISGGDRGDDPEESGRNPNLFVLKRETYGSNGAQNERREANLALVRGPNLAPTWNTPQPIFQYFYDHDNNPATPDRLWGDGSGNGLLETNEITALTPMPGNLLANIRRIKVTVQGESQTYDRRYETQGGYLSVTMNSEVYVRNSKRTSSMIYGKVFIDLDQDGVIDPDETGLPKVQVGLAGQNRFALTDNFGFYYLPLPAGTYSIQEVDPAGYTSTTANLVSITLASGQTQTANFGDRSSTPTGKIKGLVFDDLDKDGVVDLGEDGLPNVLISLDNGAEVYTGSTGRYSFIVQYGNYVVVETDPTGYSSTTPNSRSIAIAAGSDTVVTDFGDYGGPTTGSLEGYVYLDENEDGWRGGAEEGLPNVTVRVSNGDSTMTNAKGYFKFALTPGVYSLTEVDPSGYTSTTVNTFNNITIATDTVVVRNFGDILENQQDFVEIDIAHTDRALSVCAADMEEDAKSDADIVLGTALASSTGNMLVFHNEWQTSATPIGELFQSTPTYRRDAGHNINTMSKYDFSGDAVSDVLAGLDYDAMDNIQIWYTGSGGVLGTSPDEGYVSSGMNVVLDSKAIDLNNDGAIDFVLGLKNPSGAFTGGFETFMGSGSAFSSGQYVTRAGSSDEYALGEIWAIETADVDRDGDQDVIVGSHTNAYAGSIDIYLNVGSASGTFAWHSRYHVVAAVNDIKAVDMMEDDGGDVDILAAVSANANVGGVELWLNDGSGVFGIPDTTSFAFGSSVTPNWPDDFCSSAGEALCIGILNVNRDLFPDVAVGTRSSLAYTGDVYVLPTYGTLPAAGTKINVTNSGEIITMDVADFNKDNRPDIVVGTRDSATHGILVVYFGTN